MTTDLVPDRSLHAEVAAITDPGRRRTQNQDRFLVADLDHRDPDGPLLQGGDERPGVQASAFEIGARGGLLLVVDGMGGAAGGATASAMASRVIHGLMTTQWGEERLQVPGTFARHLVGSLEQANQLIHSRSRRESDLAGMGTTATVVGVLAGHLILGQVGDSRAYLVRHGVATQLTRDQSVIQMLRDSGAIDEEEARTDRRANLILQALGSAATVTVDLTHQPLRRGDLLLLCSDGLSGQVEIEEIASVLSNGATLAAAGEQLVALANERGGPDNITAVLARFDGDALAPPEADEPVGRMPMVLEDL